MKIYCATTNLGKLREFRETLGAPIELEVLPRLAAIPAPDETGTTFEENAILKARYYAKGVEGWLFAEDSGLAVDALGGAPGVYSARFSGAGATDASNNELLLSRMKACANRTARYMCVVALVKDGALAGTFRGEVEGEIALEPRGTNGFGYDPLFFYPPFGCTFGEASAERKGSVSHRGRALAAMRAFLKPE